MNNIEDMLIKEQDFTATMAAKVLPFMKENIKREYVTTKDKARIAYEYLINPNEKGAIAISHGYCEFASKYYEVMYYFYNMGYSVFTVEHRGHGYSDRMVKGFSKVHIDCFQTYVDDFDCFINQAVRPKSISGRLLLYCHSMGGAIGALYLEQHPLVFEKAVLSSPMLEMSTRGTKPAVVKLLCLLSYIPGIGRMYIPGHHDYDSAYSYPHCSALCEVRYRYQWDAREHDEHYHMNGASYIWSREAINVSKKILKNAKNIQIPVILFQASEDHLVMPKTQDEFAKLVPSVDLIRVEGSKHEIYNATDDIILDYYKQIFAFFN